MHLVSRHLLMGPQSLTFPPRSRHSPHRIALLFLLPLLYIAQSVAQGVPATTIPLILPSAIVFDLAGDLYIAEAGNHVIYKVDTTGQISTVAGTAIQGFSGDGGPATSARLDSPQGLALDADTLYIADTHNHVIRKLNLTTGQISTIAGSGSSGFSGDNGPAVRALLDVPTALALDAQNNLYIADTGNHRIRRIAAATGIITTVAGKGTQGFSGDNGPAISAAIDSPTGLAIDVAGNLFLADTHNDRIRRIAAATGLITTIAGTGAPGFSGDKAQAYAAALALPHGLALDAAGNLYLADTANHRIRVIDGKTGVITTVAGTGIQGYSGDNAAALAASLDTPRSATVSPGGLTTFADTGNQRVRQLQAQAAPDAILQTIAGLAPYTRVALTLSGSAVVPYGTGTITASIAASTPAVGVITFFDTVGSASATTLGTVALSSETAAVNTSTLPVGIHTITAVYAGDQTHSPVRSPALTLTITPRQLIASPAALTVPYGQAIPTLTGSFSGVLSQDVSSLTTAFSTTASTISTTGSYPITATITGPSAGNYALATAPASLTIVPASTVVTLTASVTTSDAAAVGTPMTFTAHVASATTGRPTGSVTLLDGNVQLLTSVLSSTGDATFTTGSLAQGSHTFAVLYSGDADFAPGASTPAAITIGTGTAPGPDFTLGATGATAQTVVSGSSTTFTFAIQTQGNLASPINLTASGLPKFATASFNPAYLPPGSAPNFTLTIATPNSAAELQTRRSRSTFWALFLLPVAGLFNPRIHRRKATLLALAALSLTPTMGCGARVNTVGAAATATTAYAITVAGTATTASGSILQHSTTVTLNLLTAN